MGNRPDFDPCDPREASAYRAGRLAGLIRHGMPVNRRELRALATASASDEPERLARWRMRWAYRAGFYATHGQPLPDATPAGS